MRRGGVATARDDREVGGRVAFRNDRIGDVARDVALSAADAQPLPHPGVHPVDRVRRLSKRVDLVGALAGAERAHNGAQTDPAGNGDDQKKQRNDGAAVGGVSTGLESEEQHDRFAIRLDGSAPPPPR